MKTINEKHQANQYDKIFKENIQAVIPSLIKNILHITAVSTEKLPDDIQHTKERKADVLSKVTDIEGNTFVLQIEFQVADELEMVYRMGDYYLMLERKYKIPVEQFVIFIGDGMPKMPTRLERKRMNFEFPLITFSELDYQNFLKSDKPEEIILAVLANFKQEKAENVIKKIIQRIEETSDGDFSLKRHFNQLRVLAQLRNLEQKLKEIIMDNVAKYIDEERDVAYLIGYDKGKETFVAYLLREANRTLDQIADTAEVSVEFVKAVKQKLSKK